MPAPSAPCPEGLPTGAGTAAGIPGEDEDVLPGLRSLGDAEHPWPEAGHRPGRNPTGLDCSGAGPPLIPGPDSLLAYRSPRRHPGFPLRGRAWPEDAPPHLPPPPGLPPLQPAAEPHSASSRPLQRLRLHPLAPSLHTPGLVPRRLLGGVTRVPQSHGTCWDQVGHQAEARQHPGSEAHVSGLALPSSHRRCPHHRPVNSSSALASQSCCWKRRLAPPCHPGWHRHGWISRCLDRYSFPSGSIS